MIAHVVRMVLLQFVWQGAAVAALLGVVLAVMPERAASRRYVACCLAMGALVALPVLTAVLASMQAEVWIVDRVFTPLALMPQLSVLVPMLGGVVVGTIERWAVMAWLCGLAVASLRLVIGWMHVNHIRRTATAAPRSAVSVMSRVARRLAMRTQTRLAMTAVAESPVVFGWRTPTILLPKATLTELTREQLEAVLAHELAHVRRADYAVNLAQVFIETVLFHHPATWWVSTRMRRERERCCDDSAVAMSGNPAMYVRALLTLERSRPASPTLAIGIGSSEHELLPRIRRLLGRDAPPPRARSMGGAIACFGLLACLGTTIAATHAQAEQLAAAGSHCSAAK